MFPKYIVRISPTLYATYSVWYGKEKQANRDLVRHIANDVKKIESELDLKNHRFIFRQLRQKNLNGLTYPSSSTTFIDPRRKTYDELLYTFVHESIHLKQVQDGDLRWDVENLALTWKGESFLDIKAINEITLQKYCELPWELDVGIRQDIIWRRVFEKDPPRMYAKRLP